MNNSSCTKIAIILCSLFCSIPYHFAQTKDNNSQSFPNITFNDVYGLKHAKETLSEISRHFDRVDQYEIENNFPKIYLLAGPSCTGKTYIAEALEGEIHKQTGRKINVWFFSAQRLIDCDTKFLERIANDFAPCIVHIDDIDQLIGSKLIFFDKFFSAIKDSAGQIIIIAETRKLKKLTEFIASYGKYSQIVIFDYPTVDEREDFLKGKYSEFLLDLDIHCLAQQTEALSFHDLETVLREALRRAKLSDARPTQGHLDQAINETQKHRQNDFFQLS